MLLRRVCAAAALVALSTCVTVVGGWPDVRQGVELMMGRNITNANQVALLAMLCWLAAALSVAAAIVGGFRRRDSAAGGAGRRSLLALAIGIVLLAVGVARHQGGYHVCCGNASAAERAEHLVH